MRYATEETPLGTAGSVRNAMDELDETLPRHLRRRAHRHRPRPPSSTFHDEREALATIGAEAGREPARVRHRHHPRRRHDRAVPREAHVGPGVLRHDQHRHLRARAGDLRLHPRGRGRRLLERRVPRAARPTASRCYGTSSTATGRTSARSRPTCRAHQDILDGQVARRASPGFQLGDGVWLGEGAEIAPDAPRRRPGRHRRQLPRRGRRRTSASTRCSAPTSW